MSKQLRLEVADLSDIGCKRDHNEDSLVYVVPKDSSIMTQYGALFVVADGMGGHAAGEVASEMAINLIRSGYYSNTGDDVISELAAAISKANQDIYQKSSEQSVHTTGMGTTCVATVIKDRTAYVANVGDSRAYLIRKGQIKQISRDHSWVAEQVRAGVLTEGEARIHAQKNVITRCLGITSEVELDVFKEELEEGDLLLLCSDGLSGTVTDEEINRIVSHNNPKQSVQKLINRANDNGGPDNITALLVKIASLPNLSKQAQKTLEQTIASPTHKLPAISSQYLPQRKALRVITSICAVVIILAIFGLFVPFVRQAYARQKLDSDLSHLQQSVQSAKNKNPDEALSLLANAQSTIQQDIQSLPLSSIDKSRAQNELVSTVQPLVQSNIAAYNNQAHISPLNQSNVKQYNLSCPQNGSNFQPVGVTFYSNGEDAFIFAHDAAGAVYLFQFNNSQDITCRGKIIDNSVLDMAAGGANLYALTVDTQSHYAIQKFSFSSQTLQKIFDLQVAGKDTVPVELSAASDGIDVLLRDQQNKTDEILHYTMNNPTPVAIQLSSQSRDFSDAGNNEIYSLLTNGTLQLISGSVTTPFNFEAPPPLIPVPSDDWQVSTPVPTTVTINSPQVNGQLSGINMLAQATVLLASNDGNTTTLFIADPGNKRVIIATGTGSKMTLKEQFTGPNLDQISSITKDSATGRIYILSNSLLEQVQP